MPKTKKRNQDENVQSSMKSKRKKPENMKETLKTRKVRELLAWMKSGVPIVIESSHNLYSALQVLVENKIHSAPVYDKTTQEYVGFLDLADDASAIVQIFEDSGKIEEKGNEKDDDQDYFEEKFTIENMKALSIMDFANKDPFVSLNEDDSILDAVNLLKSHHHIAVVNQEKKFIGIVTQFGLVEYLFEEHANKLKGQKRKVKSLDLPKEVFSVKPTDTAIQAFKKMREKKVNGLAVVEANRLLDVISTSDLTFWSEWIIGGQSFKFSNLSLLNQPVKQFLENSRSQRAIEEKKKLVTCQPNDHLHEVIENMLLHQVHRVFVCDNQTLVSIITLSDVIHYLQD